MNGLESRSTASLEHHRSFSSVALATVWGGAAVAIGAACFVRVFRGARPTETLVMALLALAASIPPYLERRRIDRELAGRGESRP